jgi:hypothetical protein
MNVDNGDNLTLDSSAVRAVEAAHRMEISFVALKLQSLCGAAAHLCSAYEELHGIGSDALAGSVLEVLTTLDELIAALDLETPASASRK